MPFVRRKSPPLSPLAGLLLAAGFLLTICAMILPDITKVATFWRRGIEKTAFVTRLDEYVEPRRKIHAVYRYTLEIEGKHYTRNFSTGLPEHQHISILVMLDRPYDFLLGSRQSSFWKVCQSNGISPFAPVGLVFALTIFLWALMDWLRLR